MAFSSIPPADPVAWARRVNSRWIVHGGLNTTAAAYLDHLAGGDSQRLVRSCELAYRLVHSLEDPAEDPKPWFYGDLFSLATEAETRCYLSEHPFLLTVIQSLASETRVHEALSTAGPAALQKIERLKAALAGVRGRRVDAEP